MSSNTFSQRPTGLVALCGRLANLQPALCAWALLCAFGVSATEPGSNAPPVDLTAVSLEALMQMDVPKVSSASKFEQKITEAPASVSVVSAEEFQRYGYRTLAEALESLQGFSVSYDRNYSFLGARGINLGDFNSRVLLLVDGHRVNNDLNDSAALGNEFILDPDLIDRVEVIRGPGSVLYGNNAFFGVINVVTRKAAQLNGVEVSGDYGEFDTYKARLTLGKAFTNGPALLLSGSFYDSDGVDRLPYTTPDRTHWVAVDLEHERYENGFGSLAYNDFTLESAFNHREKNNPTAQYFTTFNDSRLQTVDDRGYVNLKYAHSFPGVVDVAAQVYYDWNNFEIGYPFGTQGTPSALFYKETQAGQWWGTELQVSRHFWEKHLLTLGGEYRDDFRQNQHVFDPATGVTTINNNRTRQSYGVYTEGDFALLDSLHFNGGVRYDQYGDFDPAFNPRLALIYTPLESSTFKAIYGTAFRAPNFLELSDSQFRDLSPEQIHAYELVYEQGLGRYLRSSVAGFYNRMDGLILFYNGTYNNLDAESKGVELALEANWSGVIGRASYTYQNVNNLSGRQVLADSPEHLVKFNLSAPLVKDKLFAGLEVLFTSSRSTVYTTAGGATLPGTDTAPYSTVNFTLFSHNLVKNLDISASVYNLFDERYADPATRFHLQDQIPQDGRSYRVKLTYRF